MAFLEPRAESEIESESGTESGIDSESGSEIGFDSQGTSTAAGRKSSPFRRIRRILLAVFGVVLIVSAAIWGPTLWYIFRESNPTLSIPERVGGLTLDTSERAQRAADGIRDALSAPVGFDHAVAGVYQDPNTPDKSVILMAGDTTFFRPLDGINQLFSAITDTAGGVPGARAVDAGPLGGEARCGLTQIEETQVPVCAWADHGGAGLMLFPGHTIDEVAPRFLELRSATQKR